MGASEGSFAPATSFNGARKGWVFKVGAKGLGYYIDASRHVTAKEKLTRKHLGNLSWL